MNSAGVLAIGTLEDFSMAEFDRTLAVNVRSVFVAIQEAARHMGEGGRIITIGSTNAERMPFAGGGVYAMSKAAVVGLTRDLGPRHNHQQRPARPGGYRHEPGQWRIRRNAQRPDALPRYGCTEEIASFVAYLAGPEAGYITGASLTIDGGFSA